MGKNYYKLYTDDVYKLAETLVIKSEDAADKINESLVNIYGASIVNPNDKTTWKYYRNICGEYHSTDPQISIISLDTLQTITFNSENLLIHVATKKDYQYGTRNYNELVSIYPQMEMFILGVLYPADMATAVAAKDGTILSYPPDYVEPNEVSLIPNLNKWIENYKVRWYSRQFGLSDNYYTTVHLGLMYLNLVPAILNLRLAACKGPEAHSFHVRQYLLSHGMLDMYLDFLTIKQSLFFYRNIQYIERNNGKRSVFTWLVEHLMNERNLPLSELTMRHDISDMPEEYYADINFHKKALNVNYNASEKTKYNFLDMLAKEAPLVDGNVEYIAEHTNAMELKLKNSLSNVVATKMLDSSVIDYTDATPYTKTNISIAHWLYLSSIGKFSTYTSFKDPRTGDKITLHCKDAFIMFTLSYFYAMGGTITKVPPFFAQRVIRVPRVTKANLMQVADYKYASEKDATNIIGLLPTIGSYVSVDAFHKICNELYDTAQWQLGYVSTGEHHYRRAILENMVARCYADRTCSMEGPNITVVDWKIKNNIPDTVYTKAENLDIYQQLYENTTGNNLDSTKDLKDLQNAMVGLFQQLSSYSIQFLTEVNGSNIKVFNPPAVRLGDIDSHTAGQYLLYDLNEEVLSLDVTSHHESEIGAKISEFTLNLKHPTKTEHRLDITVTAHPAEQSIVYKHTLPMMVLSGETTYADPSKNLTDATSFIGYDEIWRKTNLQVGDIRDIYCDCFKLAEGIGLDLDKVILDNVLGIFKYFKVGDNVLKAFVYKDLSQELDAFVNISNTKEIDAFRSSAGLDNVPAFKPSAEIVELDEFIYTADNVPDNIYVTSREGVPYQSAGSYVPHNFGTPQNVYVSDTGVVFLTEGEAITPVFP